MKKVLLGLAMVGFIAFTGCKKAGDAADAAADATVDAATDAADATVDAATDAAGDLTAKVTEFFTGVDVPANLSNEKANGFVTKMKDLAYQYSTAADGEKAGVLEQLKSVGTEVAAAVQDGSISVDDGKALSVFTNAVKEKLGVSF